MLHRPSPFVEILLTEDVIFEFVEIVGEAWLLLALTAELSASYLSLLSISTAGSTEPELLITRVLGDECYLP